MTDRPSILQDRQKTHGSFEVNAKIWQRLFNSSMVSSLNEQQALALIMIYVKIARITSGKASFAEHWNDIAGYAHLGAEACDE